MLDIYYNDSGINYCYTLFRKTFMTKDKTMNKKQKTFLELIKNREFCGDEELAKSIEPCEEVKLHFEKLDRDIREDEIVTELAKKGLELAHPYALAQYASKNPSFAEEKHIGTQWQKDNGNYCHVTFSRSYFSDIVDVDYTRYCFVGDWGDDWWFACVRKTSDTKSSELLETLPLELEINGIKYVRR